MKTCPFCGDQMRRGWVRARSMQLLTNGIWINFETGDGEGSEILFSGWLTGRRKRVASCCVGCEAVVVDPKPRPEE